MLKLTLKCLFSPRLFKKHGDGSYDNPYESNALEKWGDFVIKTANTIRSISIYTSPIIFMFIYKKGIYTTESIQTITPWFIGFSSILVFSFIIRAFGRALNPTYVQFMNVLNNRRCDSKTYLESIREYDFDFQHWPVSYTVPSKRSSTSVSNSFYQCANTNLPIYKRIAIQILAYAAVHTFGLRLIYSGSISLIQSLLWRLLITKRAELVEFYNGKRTKLQSADGNFIDTIFVDKRSFSENGKILVICCEGNSGFYEIGVIGTPINTGYSVLGWNHPGFAGSTGKPFPSQEQNAIDAVMQYAINMLDFEVKNIVLLGWSIGGYTATWAGMTYKDIKALILDATFDDLLPLARVHMPALLSSLVKEVVRSYVDLNIAELLQQYNGPVQMIRRTNDEVICLLPGVLQTNRGNNLLIKLIQARYPDISNEELVLLREYVKLSSSERDVLENTDLDGSDRRVLKLISKYMYDVETSHCTPLPKTIFEHVMNRLEAEN